MVQEAVVEDGFVAGGSEADPADGFQAGTFHAAMIHAAQLLLLQHERLHTPLVDWDCTVYSLVGCMAGCQKVHELK